MVTFRRPPRLPPPKPPKGKNVIPFPSDRVKPPGGTRLGDIVPDPPINLEQIRKAKELELRNAIQSEGMSPFPEGKGLSELGEEVPVKDLSKENISSPEDQQLFILNRERMTPEQRAMRERDDKVMQNDLATLSLPLLKKRELVIRLELDKLRDKDPHKKNAQGLPLTETRIAVDKHYLDMIGAEIKKREEGLSGLKEEVPVKTDTEKYNDALREQQKPKDLSHLDDWMVTQGEYDINKLLEYRNLNKSTEELVNDLQYMLDYVDWKSDYTRSGRHSKAEAFTAKEKKEIAAAERREQGSSGLLEIDLRKQRDIGDFFHLLSDEIEKRMRDE